jgi:exopolysaccharide biosynthesis polyprenyl glycosylphosphotransferase
MSKKTPYIDISERKLLLRIVDIGLIVFSLWLATLFLNFSYLEFNNPSIYLWCFILAFYFLIFGAIFQLYNLDVSNNRFQVVRSIAMTAFVVTIFYIFTPYIAPSLPENRLQIIYFYLLISLPVMFWRFVYMAAFFSPKYFKNIIIIGHSSRLEKILELVKEKGFHNLSVYISDSSISTFSNFKSIDNVNILEFVKNHHATEIITSTSHFSEETTKKLNRQLILLFEKGVNIKSFESFYEELTDRVPVEYLSHDFYKNINFSKNNDNGFYLFINRFIDILTSLLGLVAFIIVFPIIFFGNLFANRGPLFYTQKRVGKKGKTFKIYKLRSMIKNAEENGAVWAQKNDKRITAFGKFLRNTRLDEAPQFYNILKGDMSLIGPRPERPEFVKDLEEQIPFYAIRHVVRPGLTGWAQVNYPYANTLKEQETKLRYDLFYIKERSVFLDFKILIKTITTVLFYRGQ